MVKYHNHSDRRLVVPNGFLSWIETTLGVKALRDRTVIQSQIIHWERSTAHTKVEKHSEVKKMRALGTYAFSAWSRFQLLAFKLCKQILAKKTRLGEGKVQRYEGMLSKPAGLTYFGSRAVFDGCEIHELSDRSLLYSSICGHLDRSLWWKRRLREEW